MKLDLGKYQIVTDDRQFIVQEKKVAGETAKDVGAIYWSTNGYYSNLESALKSLGKTVLLENDDLKVIQKELKFLQSRIKEFTKMLESELEEE